MHNMYIERIEQHLKQFLQKDVTCNLHQPNGIKKIFKKGKFILFTIKEFYITLYFTINGLQKKCEVPAPFSCSIANDQLHFDYSLDNIHHDDPYFKIKVLAIPQIKNSKFYDCKMIICE